MRQERLPLIVQLKDFTGGDTALKGVQAAVYNNQLLNSALTSMQETAVSLLQASQEESIIPVSGLVDLETLFPANKQ